MVDLTAGSRGQLILVVPKGCHMETSHLNLSKFHDGRNQVICS